MFLLILIDVVFIQEEALQSLWKTAVCICNLRLLNSQTLQESETQIFPHTPIYNEKSIITRIVSYITYTYFLFTYFEYIVCNV